MSTPRIDPRLVEVPPEHRQLLAELVAAHGVTEAARLAGLGRVGLLGIVARGTCMPAQAALVREFAARQDVSLAAEAMARRGRITF